MQIIDGKKISQEIKDEVKEEVAQLKAEGKHIFLHKIRLLRLLFANDANLHRKNAAYIKFPNNTSKIYPYFP